MSQPADASLTRRTRYCSHEHEAERSGAGLSLAIAANDESCGLETRR
jgi:hypothetical protein